MLNLYALSMKIAVTGASGHVGNVVCRKLIEKGCKVKAFYNSDSRSLENLDLELVQGNVLNKSDLSKLRCNDDLQHLHEEQNLSRNSSLAHGDQIGGIELKYKVQNNINVICNNLHS